MAIEVETPEGIVEFPEGTTADQIKLALRRRYWRNEDAFNANPTEGMSWSQRFFAGAGKAMTDIARGAGQMAGLVSQEEIDAARARDAALMQTGAGAAGNIVGGVAIGLPAMLVPGANTLAGAAATGAALGALQPTATGESRVGNVALGATGGVAGQAAGTALSRVLNPQTRAPVRELMDIGVTPTPGQIMGGAAQRMESALESVPIIGQGIRNAKERGIEQFNLGALNKALAPIGARVRKIGNEGIQAASQKIDEAYKEAYKLLPRVDLDPAFNANVQNVRDLGRQMVPARAAQLESILKDQLFDKITPAGTMSGDTFGTVSSQLKSLSRDMMKSPDFDQRQLGSALNAVVQELKEVAARNSPKAAQAIKKADTAFASFLRLERASGMQGAREGVFSPAQLGSAARAMDTSLRRGASARGRALMQDTANTGRAVLGETLPNSGTADRLMTPLALGGAYMVDPTLAAAGIAGRAAYTAPGQRAIAAAMTQRPEIARSAGNLVQQAAPIAGLAGIQALLNE